MRNLTIVLALIIAMSGVQNAFADVKCECYQMGYRDGAMSSRSGGPRTIPDKCNPVKNRDAQMPGRSDSAYSLGYSYGKNIDSSVFASVRSKNAKWTQDRKNENDRYKRLLCY